MSKVSTDPIADMLTRLRNAIAIQKSELKLPHSKAKETVALLLRDSGFISDVKVAGDGNDKTLNIIVQGPNENARITEIIRLSKPGRRYYVGASEIPIVKRGRGIVVVSTSKGMMTGDKAKKLGVGGELICRVY
jgi:small subunit ribosomal protein S8